MENKIGFLNEDLNLKGWKVTSIELKENELIIQLTNRKKATSQIIFVGLISFKDKGVIGKPLSGLQISDQGSFKKISLKRITLEILFFAVSMEVKYVPPKLNGRN